MLPHRPHDAPGSYRGGVANAIILRGAAGYPLGFLGDDSHVAGGGPDILGSDVRAPQRINEAAVRPPEVIGNQSPIANDYRLPPTQRKAGGRRFESHRPGKPQGVDQRRLVVLVWKKSGPA